MSYRKITLPEWTDSLPDHSLMVSHDISSFFGFSAKSSLAKYIKEKHIPKPDKIFQRSSVSSKYYWQLGKLRQIAKEQAAQQAKDD